MTILLYFLCIGLGIGIDAFYRKRSEVAERKAFSKGYKKGYKEGLKDGEEKAKQHTELPLFDTSYTVATVKTRDIRRVPESFMDDLHNNGSAVIKLR